MSASTPVYNSAVPTRVLRLVLAAAAAFVLVPSERAQAQGVYVVGVASPQAAHSPGFYGRLTLGVGYSHTRLREPAADLLWGGVGAEASLSLGLMMPNTLAVHADILGASVFEPRVRREGASSSGTAVDVTYTTGGLGVGLTKYFPSNGYLTAGLGLAIASLEAGGDSYDSDLGGYVTIGAGREWLLSPLFGIGVIGRVTAYRIGIEGEDNLTTIVPSVSVSLSFN